MNSDAIAPVTMVGLFIFLKFRKRANSFMSE